MMTLVLIYLYDDLVLIYLYGDPSFKVSARRIILLATINREKSGYVSIHWLKTIYGRH